MKDLLSRIIQGEAAPCGEAMVMVAECLAECIKRGDDYATLDRRWCGKREPTDRARELAAGVLDGTVTPNGCYFCMSQDDVDLKGWVDGDIVVRCGAYANHGYREWPRKKAIVDFIEKRREFWKGVKAQALELGWDRNAGNPLPPDRGLSVMALAAPDYPRPANGSRRWMHWSALCWPCHAGYQKHLDTIAAMKCGGVKFLSDGNGKAGGGPDAGLAFAVDVLARGMVPVVRYYCDADHRWSEGNQYATEAYVRAGCRYIETINEPDLDYEWSDDRLPPDWAERSFANWIEHARHIIALGGIPLSPALASGFMQARGDTAGQLTFNPFKMVKEAGIPYFACSIHNYALNHPIAYPSDPVNQSGAPLTQAEYDRVGGAYAWDSQSVEQINEWRRADVNPGDGIYQDDSCFRACEIFRDMLNEAGYPDVPIITTEGGPCLTDRQDRRYPRVTPVVMQDQIEDELAYMTRDPLYLGYSWWLFGNPAIGGSGGWSTNQWFWPGGPFSESDGHIPIVRWMRERPLSADGVPPQPDPDPDPEPEPPDPLPDPPLPPVENDAEAYGVSIVPAVVAAGETYWRIVKVHHLTPEENNGQHNVFLDVIDRDGKRVQGAQIAWGWVGGESGMVTTIDKTGQYGADIPIDSIRQIIKACVESELSSDRVRGLSSDHPDEGPVTGWGYPGNTVSHHSFAVVWQLADAPEPEPDPEPEPEPEPGDVTESDIRNAAWVETGIPYNPDAAFPTYARAHGLGMPLTPEFDINDTVRAQGYAGGIVYATIGDWANIHKLEW
jgi:hypothetical protein